MYKFVSVYLVVAVLACGCAQAQKVPAIEKPQPAAQQQEPTREPEAVEPVQPEPTADELKTGAQQLLKRMASKKYREREAATEKLRDLLKDSGRHAGALVEHLKKHLKESQDPEVNNRLEIVLDRYFKPWKYCEKVHTLKGHKATVYSVVFSPDGKLLASGSADKTIRIWDAENGKCLRTLKGHNKEVRSVAFSSDGKLLASGSEDCTVRIWNLETGECLRTIKAHEIMVSAVKFSPDGKLLASSGGDYLVRLWDPGTGKLVRKLVDHYRGVLTLDFSGDGKLLASGDWGGAIHIYNPQTGELLRKIKEGDDGVWSVSCSKDGSRLASVGESATIRISNAQNGKVLKNIETRYRAVSTVLSPDGRYLAAGESVNSVCIWDTETGECLRTFLTPLPFVLSVSFSPDGKRLAYTGGNRFRMAEIHHSFGMTSSVDKEDWSVNIWSVPDR